MVEVMEAYRRFPGGMRLHLLLTERGEVKSELGIIKVPALLDIMLEESSHRYPLRRRVVRQLDATFSEAVSAQLDADSGDHTQMS